MSVHHDMMFGGLFDDVHIMVIHRLAIVMVSSGDNIAYISRLYGIISIFVHQLISLFDMTFVILCRRRSFVVHHQLYSFRMGIVIKSLDVKIRIWRYKVENITFPHVCPVFPSYVPSFNQYLVKTVFSGKVNVSAYLFVVGSMTTMWFYTFPIHLIYIYRREVIRIMPVALTNNHLPPYATVFGWMNP